MPLIATEGVDMHGNIYRWVLAAVLMAMLCGCGEDEEKSASNTSIPPAGGVPAPSPAPLPPVQPRAATLEWTVPTTQTDGAVLADLAGYRIHYGKSASTLDKTIEVRNPTISSYVVEGLSPGTYYFAVTAFTSRNHESERSTAGRKQII